VVAVLESSSGKSSSERSGKSSGERSNRCSSGEEQRGGADKQSREWVWEFTGIDSRG